nr:MAG TPA_asm: hypothetical protein [Bacteriophage sp.]DAZ60571.1 MAG TPA: hypothetical protein [Caudoviricetes sp.]
MGRIFSGQIRLRLCEIPPRKGRDIGNVHHCYSFLVYMI